MSEKHLPTVGEWKRVRVMFTDADGNDVSAVMLKNPAVNQASCPGIEIYGEFGAEELVSVPSKFGAVIRRADGVMIVRAECDKAGGPDWWSPELGWLFEGTATEGGFTILFDGVDE